ncbi:MAG: ABC transporter permease, partial [Bacteroidota bacterium]
MSIALASVFCIAIWVMDELSVDGFHKKGNRLVQILQNLPTPNGIETDEATQGPLAKALLNEFPEIEESTTVLHNSWFEGEKFLLSDGEGQFFSSAVQFAGKNYFNMFSFPLLYGSPDEALIHKNSVVISEAMARKLFGTTNAVGETIECLHDEFGGNYTVSAVFQRLPKNSSEQFDAVFNFETLVAYDEDFREWSNSDTHTYVLLKEGTSLIDFNAKIKNFLKTREGSALETYLGQLYPERYLHGKYENGKVVGGRIQYVYLFSIIAFLILIIACVNFVNLSTARASTRIREIGVKKTMGAERRSLIVQFATESIAISAIGMLFALLIVRLLLPQFNAVAGKELTLNFDSTLILGILVITLFTGFVAGIYPALYLSGLSALNGLRGKIVQNLGGDFTRKGLVVFQFVSSIILIVSVLIVYKQMEFVQNKNLGFNRDNVIWFNSGVMESNLATNGDASGMSSEDIESFVAILRNTPGVVNASNFRHTMMADFGTTTGLHWPGKDLEIDGLFAQIAGGHNFIETMQIELKEGRTYSKNF